MSLDFRTRKDGDETPVDPQTFFSTELPAALERSREQVEPGAALLGLRPFTLETGGEVWSLLWEGGTVRVRPGPVVGGARLAVGARVAASSRVPYGVPYSCRRVSLCVVGRRRVAFVPLGGNPLSRRALPLVVGCARQAGGMAKW